MADRNQYTAPQIGMAQPALRTHRRGVSWPVYFLSVLLAVAITLGAAFWFFHGGKARNITSKLREIDLLVNRYYSGEVDYDVLDDAVLSAYMQGLGDKYAFYESKEDAEMVSDSFVGDTTGIGVTVYYDAAHKGLFVFRVDQGSPAQKAGLQIGDIITAVDGTTVAERGYEKSVAAIRREIGQTAELTLLRAKKTIKRTVTYERFVKQSVYTEQLGTVGYICFTAFNEATVAQFEQALADFEKAGVSGLIFDVRDNGGGTVDSVCEILDRLVGKCNLMTVAYADGEKKVTHTSDKNEVNLPMVVLTNGATASASELFAATIRDTEKGLLIGEKTYGKGVMQRTYFLTDGSCVRFTVGTFYPAGGVCFNGEGLTPDHPVTLTEEQQAIAYFLPNEDPYVLAALSYLEG